MSGRLSTDEALEKEDRIDKVKKKKKKKKAHLLQQKCLKSDDK